MILSSEVHVPTVLIVDDDPQSLLLVSTMVEYVGYRALTADSFATAIALFDKQPSALVLDLVMPEWTSERLLEYLQNTNNSIPVVLMSAALRDQLGKQAVELARRGVNVVSTLAKPFWVDVLMSALEQAVPGIPKAPI